MFKLASAAVLTSATLADKPELGCYGFSLETELFKAKAQIEIKTDSTLDFSVRLTLPQMPPIDKLCPDEVFTFDPSTSTMWVGQSLTPCVQDLKNSLNGVVETPIPVKYDASDKSLNAEIVMPVKMTKVKCQTGTVAPSVTLAPVSTMATAPTSAGTDATTSQSRVKSGNYDSDHDSAVSVSAISAVIIAVIAVIIL